MDSVAHAYLVRTRPASPPAQLESRPQLAQCVWINTKVVSAVHVLHHLLGADAAVICDAEIGE